MKKDEAEILAMLLKLSEAVNGMGQAVEALQRSVPVIGGLPTVQGHLSASREALDEFLEMMAKTINADV